MFGNNSTCSNLPFTFEMKKTFENFERAKIQPGLVKKEVNQSRKLGQNLHLAIPMKLKQQAI